MQPSTRTSREPSAKDSAPRPRVYHFVHPRLTRASIVVDGSSGWTAQQHEVLGERGVLFLFRPDRDDAKAVFVPWWNISSVECVIERSGKN